jgi:hypothetical protein
MKRIIKLLFIAFAFPVLAYGQDLGKQLDYQYKREGQTYHAYTLYANDNQEKNTIDIVLTTTFDVDNLQRISLDLGTSVVKLSYKKLKTVVPIDDKALHNVLIRLDLSNIELGKDCEQSLVFKFSKDRTVVLPIQLCKIINQ